LLHQPPSYSKLPIKKIPLPPDPPQKNVSRPSPENCTFSRSLQLGRDSSHDHLLEIQTRLRGKKRAPPPTIRLGDRPLFPLTPPCRRRSLFKRRLPQPKDRLQDGESPISDFKTRVNSRLGGTVFLGRTHSPPPNFVNMSGGRRRPAAPHTISSRVPRAHESIPRTLWAGRAFHH